MVIQGTFVKEIGNCDYCKKQSKFLVMESHILSRYIRLLCEDHKLEYRNGILKFDNRQ